MKLATRFVIVAASVGLTAGCATTRSYGKGAGDGAPPPLPPGVSVPMWDHYCAQVTAGAGVGERVTQILDTASAAGWEMVAAGGDGVYCFKRPHVDTNAPAPASPAP